MKPLKERVKDYLEREPRSRERRFRTRSIVNLLRPGLSEEEKKGLIALIEDAESANRYFRMIQMTEPALRGADWDDKKALEQSKILSLGYSVGHHADIQKLKTL